jgi:hypothetical protein
MNGSEAMPVIEITLETRAKRINAHIKLSREYAQRAIEEAVEAGLELIEAKAKCVYSGEWGKWLANSCDMKPREASRYMDLAREYPNLSTDQQGKLSGLTVRQAVEKLSEVMRQPKRIQKPIPPETPNQAQIGQPGRYEATLGSIEVIPVEPEIQAQNAPTNEPEIAPTDAEIAAAWETEYAVTRAAEHLRAFLAETNKISAEDLLACQKSGIPNKIGNLAYLVDCLFDSSGKEIGVDVPIIEKLRLGYDMYDEDYTEE